MKYFTLDNSWNWCWGTPVDKELSLLRDTLLWRYCEPIRKYHTVSHLENMLVAFRSYLETIEISGLYEIEHLKHFELAVWFHDAIYDPKAIDNEYQSAVLMDKAIGSRIPTPRLAWMKTLIMATAVAAHENTRLSNYHQLIQDIDLVTLGGPSIAFMQYSQQIREEYNWVDDKTYIINRKKILELLLKKDSLYHIEYFRKLYEDNARRNIEQAIRYLDDELLVKFNEAA